MVKGRRDLLELEGGVAEQHSIAEECCLKQRQLVRRVDHGIVIEPGGRPEMLSESANLSPRCLGSRIACVCQSLQHVFEATDDGLKSRLRLKWPDRPFTVCAKGYALYYRGLEQRSRLSLAELFVELSIFVEYGW